MNIIYVCLGVMFLAVGLLMYALCKASGKISRMEEDDEAKRNAGRSDQVP